jgi:hypothetical protein
MEEMVCWGCVGDPHLKKEIRAQGATEHCSFCSKRRKCMSIDWLADRVADVLFENIRPGDTSPVWGDDDDDRPSHYEQAGDPLNFWVTDVLKLGDEADPVVSAVCGELGPSHYDVMQGGEGRFDTDAQYVRLRRRPVETEKRWQSFRAEIMHGRRFFNTEAKQFLDWLFTGVETSHGYGLFETGVVREIQAGTSFFRARRCDSSRVLDAVLKNPKRELAAPPRESARAGRMNPEGVRFFYGAFDRATCVAELRPPVGGDVVSGKFRVTRDVRIFDFMNLESAYFAGPSSYFSPDYNEYVERKHFLQTLHDKISIPVLPDAEHEYLATQVIAEYFATQFPGGIDGVIFRSAQYQSENSSKNIALFTHVLPNVELLPDSLQVHIVKGATYDTRTRDVLDGRMMLDADDYESEWDWAPSAYDHSTAENGFEHLAPDTPIKDL